MQVRSFLLTLGLGMAAGGTVALMLPRQSGVRREAQKAADAVAERQQKGSYLHRSSSLHAFLHG